MQVEENYYLLFLFNGNVRWNALDMQTFSNDELWWKGRASSCQCFLGKAAQMANNPKIFSEWFGMGNIGRITVLHFYE